MDVLIVYTLCESTLHTDFALFSEFLNAPDIIFASVLATEDTKKLEESPRRARIS
ncbi:uncharacterized protein PHALS_12590 [Plasmopara halstedii]|uniref:Uncharacterized protein n=1 Tax=Plasmopara halstedii TaxID=4781 RepID=A0A0P1AML3_PLAHL|nr:uncharacterized protein PHALS_12590 [Plasmopara halstedii]CEG42306.1 hypothetical protein PHALS_12590 [Plasmopara halstedii]|eukprot:XP_024578675.1 hypothetical protein PHALS_12590 [Plasmopara halstedii]